jgi:hypothetical protein
MSRARTAAVMLAAVAVIVPTSVATEADGAIHVKGIAPLSATPPVPLPAHPPAVHQVRSHRRTALPNTGMDVPEELLLASVLLAAGARIRVRRS